MKKLALFILVVGVGWWALQRTGGLPLLRSTLGFDSAACSAFQEFATAMVRGQIDTVARLVKDDAGKRQASRLYGTLSQFVRHVHAVEYRVEAEEDDGPEGDRISLLISQTLTADLVGSHSALGSVVCEGKYAATMEKLPEGWKVSSFKVESAAVIPEDPIIVLEYAGTGARWPCTKSAFY